MDAVNNQVKQLEASAADAQKLIKALQASKRDLQAQMSTMYSEAELQAAKAEAGKLRGVIDGLNQQLRASQGEVEKLTSTVQARDTVKLFSWSQAILFQAYSPVKRATSPYTYPPPC